MSQWFQAGVGGTQPEVYERDLVPAIFGPWADELIDLAAIGAGAYVLDVACGTGVVARAAARRIGPDGGVVGLDLNSSMLTVARSRPSPGGTIMWREGDAAALPFPDRAFDAVLCQQGLQFMPDKPAALREMRRVLAPDGRAVLSVWRSIGFSPGFAVLAEGLARHVGPGLLTGPFRLDDADELRALLAQAGFRDIAIQAATKPVRFPSVETFFERYVAGSPLAGALAPVDELTRAAIVSDVRLGLQTFLGADGLSFPIESHLAVAHP